MPFYGDDGTEVLNERNLTMTHWRKLGHDISTAIDECHKYNVIHGDVKLENVVSDSKKWVLIDFGLASFRREDELLSPPESGTIPYVLPFAPKKHQRYRYMDYFGLAVTMLSFCGYLYQDQCYHRVKAGTATCCNSQVTYCVLDIALLYDLRFGDSEISDLYMKLDNHPNNAYIVDCLCDIVLSQFDQEAEFLVWNVCNKKFHYEGKNPYYLQEFRVRDIETAWRDLKNHICENASQQQQPLNEFV